MTENFNQNFCVVSDLKCEVPSSLQINSINNQDLSTKSLESGHIHSMIFGRLTLEQKKAVDVPPESSLLIVAGPGSGKTATITARIIKFLIEGYTPILALTFTKKAANELKSRINVAYSSSLKSISIESTKRNSVNHISKNSYNISSLSLTDKDLFIGTIHSFCWKLLKQYGTAIGLPSKIEVADKEMMLKILKLCLTEVMNISKAAVASQLSASKLESLDDLLSDPELDQDHFESSSDAGDSENEENIQKNINKQVPVNKNSGFFLKNSELERILKIIRLLKYKQYGNGDKDLSINDTNGNVDLLTIYNIYTNKMKFHKPYLLDYTDLILTTLRLLERSKETTRKIQKLYPFIFCDEFQDTSKSQMKILEILAKRNKLNISNQSSNLSSLWQISKISSGAEGSIKVQRGGITVVGDDDQAIYSWRGVEIGVFKQFSLAFSENYQIMFLKENFRSTSSIVDTSKCLISANSCRIPKEIYTNNSKGICPQVLFLSTHLDEALWICRTILSLRIRYKYVWTDFAILARTNEILMYIEKVFSDPKFVKRAIEDESDHLKFSGSIDKILESEDKPKKGWRNMMPKDLEAVKPEQIKNLILAEGTIPMENTAKSNPKITRDLLQKTEILDILAYCRLLVDETADDCFLRICNRPKRGFGNNILRLIEQSGAEGVSLLRKSTQPLKGLTDVLCSNANKYNHTSNNSCPSILQICRKLVQCQSLNSSILADCRGSKKIIECLRKFTECLDNLKKFLEEQVGVSEILKRLLSETGYLDYLDEDEKYCEDSESKKVNKKRNSRKRFFSSTLEESEEHIDKLVQKKNTLKHSTVETVGALIKYSEMYNPNKQQPRGFDCLICFLLDVSHGLMRQKHGEGITLTTIHKSKGLEWQVVFMPRFNEGVIPLSREDSTNTDAKIASKDYVTAEERRIAYVGMTRAKCRLFLSVPLNMGKPSTFLNDANLKFTEPKQVTGMLTSKLKCSPKTVAPAKWLRS
ncbi:UvrD/REP helicase domain-containing protein [Cryptosporidium muris RN66]|uniref:DNA 3'-5' helicase n=1 Tax=Cryptosporidium muris (strain RN66) TaxID=441375 RepID=B6AC17_CRYMR|nr:UvrD/REP helicase domain-containing protein [Cryptosporidium muris RN66]EEA05370.1 UvrD/REP helicase domain-containing protein [Cryptosporidium muris RN66]|eukprot:XP_002139719.1 UvrD/REP helicase domain-containing protein [Cryptosporidium muris RN66]